MKFQSFLHLLANAELVEAKLSVGVGLRLGEGPRTTLELVNLEYTVTSPSEPVDNSSH
jgi:hypothetical protein